MLLALAVRRWASFPVERGVAWGLSALLVGHEAAELWVRSQVYGYPVADNLPLHLCGISVLLAPFVLVGRSYPVFELLYFWGLTGSLAALLTPDLPYGFPHIIFLSFFLSHSLVVVAVVYAVVVHGLRPRHRSVWRAFGATVVYAGVVAPVNLALGTNYLYLRVKPEGATVIDFLGPWPWYLLGLAALGLALFYLVYLPFASSGRRASTPP